MKNKQQIILYLAALVLISFGVAAIAIADCGVGAFDAVIMTLADWGGDALTIGTVIYGFSFLFVMIAFVIERSGFRWQSLLTSVTIGFLIDIWFLVIFPLFPEVSGWLVFITGMVSVSMGVVAIINSGMPMSAIDVPLVLLQKYTSLAFGTLKLLFDLVTFLIAFLIGGPIGLGTLILTFGIGPLIDILDKKIKPLLS